MSIFAIFGHFWPTLNQGSSLWRMPSGLLMVSPCYTHLISYKKFWRAPPDDSLENPEHASVRVVFILHYFCTLTLCDCNSVNSQWIWKNFTRNWIYRSGSFNLAQFQRCSFFRLEARREQRLTSIFFKHHFFSLQPPIERGHSMKNFSTEYFHSPLNGFIELRSTQNRLKNSSTIIFIQKVANDTCAWSLSQQGWRTLRLHL